MFDEPENTKKLSVELRAFFNDYLFRLGEKRLKIESLEVVKIISDVLPDKADLSEFYKLITYSDLLKILSDEEKKVVSSMIPSAHKALVRQISGA
jgi:hypothetical protein